jgi:hypothetical protein
MITLKQWMDAVDYRITEGSKYLWSCFGDNAYTFDSWNGDQQGHSASIIIDTKTQEVYQTTVYDFANERAYRMINPIYARAYRDECTSRDCEDAAWDEVKYVDLDINDDFLEKMTAIIAGEDYDTRVEVPLTLDNDQLFELMKLAHQQDITLNQLVEKVLVDEINRNEQRPAD